MIPKIEIRCSWIYNEINKEAFENLDPEKSYIKRINKTYPSYEEIQNYTKKINPIWKKKERLILTEIQKISGLKWKEKKIIVYVVGSCVPFSDPLTMPCFKDKNYFIDTLTHELIHQIQVQNNKNWDKFWIYVNKNYHSESRSTKIHIFLQAIHYKLLLKLFGRKRLNEHIRKYDKDPDYKRAWEIVKQEGANKIIKNYKPILK